MRILKQAPLPACSSTPRRPRIAELPGVQEVHDLRVWTLTSGLDTASGHVTLTDGADYHAVLDSVATLLAEEYKTEPTTIQCGPAHPVERPTPI